MNGMSLRSRRRFRQACLRLLRVVRHHHLTLMSAVVIASALGLTLTSHGFDTAASPRPATAQVASEALAVTVVSSRPASTARLPRAGPVAFYIASSAEQIAQLEQSLMDDSRFQASHSSGPVVSVRNFFFLVTTPEEEAQAILFLNDLVELFVLESSLLRVYDVRQ